MTRVVSRRTSIGVSTIYCCISFFFFFQAEDGIRDWSVTGVQTCALPISQAGINALLNQSSLGIQLLELVFLRVSQRSEEHTSELQSLTNLVCRLLLEKKKNISRPVIQLTCTMTRASIGLIVPCMRACSAT